MSIARRTFIGTSETVDADGLLHVRHHHAVDDRLLPVAQNRFETAGRSVIHLFDNMGGTRPISHHVCPEANEEMDQNGTRNNQPAPRPTTEMELGEDYVRADAH